jgi:hypothetical protein
MTGLVGQLVKAAKAPAAAPRPDENSGATAASPTSTEPITKTLFIL